jgi:hypothetical protein
MKIAIVAASIILAGLSTAAPAQNRDWRDRYVDASPTECWNPRANHFEAVRSGERQDDLDYSRCRSTDFNGRRWRDESPRECWNSRAGHYEEVRLGEVQNDLDFSRCRR